ncbi:MAG: hypothetical protein ABSA33_01165 [Candidatus Micrarchaeaceae archaeon]|jgi:hypothetical protein
MVSKKERESVPSIEKQANYGPIARKIKALLRGLNPEKAKRFFDAVASGDTKTVRELGEKYPEILKIGNEDHFKGLKSAEMINPVALTIAIFKQDKEMISELIALGSVVSESQIAIANSKGYVDIVELLKQMRTVQRTALSLIKLRIIP